MGLLLDVIIFAILGGLLGFILPFVSALIYASYIRATEKNDADFTAVGAFSFIPLVTVPAGVVIGIVIAILKALPIFGG